MIDFNIGMLDSRFLEARAIEEADKIKNNKSFILSGRSYTDLLTRTRQGHAAEVFLMEWCGFIDDERDYHDVCHSDGVPVEIKVIGSVDYLDVNLERWTWDKTNNPWKEWPDELMIWENKYPNPDYKFLGHYRWIDNTWRK